MTRFERRLNRRLIDDLYERFLSHVKQVRFDRRRAAHQVPRSARKKWREDRESDRRRPENSPYRLLADFLRLEIERQLESLQQMGAANAEFRKSYARVLNAQEAHRLLLDYATELGSTRWSRWGDHLATRRWMQDDALNDRYQWLAGEIELAVTFMLDRLGIVIDKILRLTRDATARLDTWQRLGVDMLLRDVLSYTGDGRVRIAGFQALRRCLTSFAPGEAARFLSVDLQASVQRAASERRGDVWLQCAAIDILEKLAVDLHQGVVAQRLAAPQEGDDLFVRRHCIRVIAAASGRTVGSSAPQVSRDQAALWDALQNDTSDAVRQQLAEALWSLPAEFAWPHIRRCAQDPVPQVRAMAALTALRHLHPSARTLPFLSLLRERLTTEDDSFVLRLLLHVAARWITLWNEQRHERENRPQRGSDPQRNGIHPRLNDQVQQTYREQLLPAINRLRVAADAVPVRRWAAEAAEAIWLQLDPAATALARDLQPYLQRLRPGRSVRVPKCLIQREPAQRLGRSLAVLTQEDYGLELSRDFWGYRLSRPPSFGFRCWRAWFEFWQPATDKRQAHRHTVGRIARGTMRVPSRVLGELSQTKVPGEPLVVGEDGTWRPFLPLPDDFVSTLNQNWIVNRPTEIFSSEGVTRIEAPRNPVRRIRAAIRLMLRLPKLAELRNWESGSAADPRGYLRAFQREGFRVTFEPYPGLNTASVSAEWDAPHASLPVPKPYVELRRDESWTDSSVTQFFPAVLAVGGLTPMVRIWDYIHDYAYYFGSAFENTLQQLVVFAGVALVGFLTLHLFRNLRIAAARGAIPLSLGGWGTRGKSGTERLKAALLCATGHGIVSKTTGCEAMFIHSAAMGDPLEIPLYRPGDKATIWEQANLLRIAKQLRPSVFLWECMALSPDYVDVLQRQWMHDDLATVTNTYPDHEDLQGPSGYDVATTISGFVPRKSRVLTTERQMLPLLREACRRVDTELRPVDWIASGMITDDLLERFPYREHPDNIALVSAMADELGIDFDRAVKAMADYLIADLGVLKTHPTAEVQHAKIEFTNGMSANERFGALGNWKRLGFDQHDPVKEPSTWISTVVNNRADRVARSRVFASIVVRDIRVERHFLIGSNLKGLQGFIWQAWGEYLETVTLLEGDQWNADAASRIFQELVRRFRVPATGQQVVDRLRPMLRCGLAEDVAEAICERLLAADVPPDSLRPQLEKTELDAALLERIDRHYRSLVAVWQQIEAFRQRILARDAAEVATQLDRDLQQLLTGWFSRKLVVIENFDATGDEVIQRIVDETPPGYLNRVMGMQNIKGTGLDFVYRFHAWDTCFQACALLEQTDQTARQTGLNVLASLPEYGSLCAARVRQTLDSLREAVPPVTADMQIQLESIAKKLAASQTQAAVASESSDTPAWVSHPWVAGMIERVEEWIEVQDALRRRRQSDLIYQDLKHARIGRQRAVQELRKLNKRQKGGWLAARLSGKN